MGRSSIPIRNGNAGTWRDYFLSELSKLEQVPQGTDSLSPHRPRSEVLNVARQIADSLVRDDLLLPLVAAGSDGSLQIKWQKDSRKLSFFISFDGVEFVCISLEIEEGPLGQPAQANELVAWMLGRNLLRSLCSGSFDFEPHAFAMLKEAHHLKQVFGARIATRAEHPHQALRRNARGLGEARKPNGRIDVVAQDGLRHCDFA